MTERKEKGFSTTIEELARKRIKSKIEEKKMLEKKEEYEREKPILTQLERKSQNPKNQDECRKPDITPAILTPLQPTLVV